MVMLAFLFLSLTIADPARATTTKAETEMSDTQPAQMERSFLIGHNLTPTTDTLRRGQVTVGNQMAGTGVTDRLTLATSPWMAMSYNTYLAGLRYRASLNSRSSVGIQTAYLRSADIPPQVYQMELTNTTLSWDRQIRPWYLFQLSLNHMWFIDETIPFSLRREPYNDRPFQFALTTLNRVEFASGFGALIEVGVLGLEYTYPQAYMGTSLHYAGKFLLIQMGFSANGNLRGFERLYSDQQAAPRGEKLGDDFALHPEFQLQAHF